MKHKIYKTYKIGSSTYREYPVEFKKKLSSQLKRKGFIQEDVHDRYYGVYRYNTVISHLKIKFLISLSLGEYDVNIEVPASQYSKRYTSQDLEHLSTLLKKFSIDKLSKYFLDKIELPHCYKHTDVVIYEKCCSCEKNLCYDCFYVFKQHVYCSNCLEITLRQSISFSTKIFIFFLISGVSIIVLKMLLKLDIIFMITGFILIAISIRLWLIINNKKRKIKWEL